MMIGGRHISKYKLLSLLSFLGKWRYQLLVVLVGIGLFGLWRYAHNLNSLISDDRKLPTHLNSVSQRYFVSSCQNQSQRTLPAISLPLSPLDCNLYLPQCASDNYPNYYSPNDILTRSREFYLAQRIPRSAQDSPDNVVRLKDFVAKLKDCSRKVVVTVLGGSLTAGRFVGGYDGAWPKLLETSLMRHRNESCARFRGMKNVVVINRAEPATTSSWAVHRLHNLIPENSDLIIVDYDVNDCALLQDSKAARDEMQGITELMIRRILLRTRGAVSFLNVAINHRKRPLRGECYMLNTCYAIDEIRLPILRSYGIPLVSQKASVWANFSCPPPPSIWPCSTFCSHPGTEAHELLANLVSEFTLVGIELYSTNPILSSSPLPSMPCAGTSLPPLLKSVDAMDSFICKHPISFVDASNSRDMLRPTLSSLNQSLSHVLSRSALISRDSCWTFREDVIGKPGWIGEDCINKSITFQVLFGDRPSLTLSVLTTYPPSTGMVKVSVAKLGPPETIEYGSINSALFADLGLVDLLRDDNDYRYYSLASTVVFDSSPRHSNFSELLCHFYDDDDNQKMRHLNLENSAALVKITQLDGNIKAYLSREKLRSFEHRPNPQKVKVLAVYSC